MPAQPILSVDEFPITDGSTACIPLIAQIMADTTGLDLETAPERRDHQHHGPGLAQPGLYGNNYGDSVKLIIAYEAPESVKEELKADGDPLEQKAIGRDALVFIVNEDNPVQSLTLQQLKDIYAGTITNWKDVGGSDMPIVVVDGNQVPVQEAHLRSFWVWKMPANMQTSWILPVLLWQRLHPHRVPSDMFHWM